MCDEIEDPCPEVPIQIQTTTALHRQRIIEMLDVADNYFQPMQRDALTALVKERYLLAEALSDRQGKCHLLESDLREWTETFAPYGCEPQACLHTFEELISQAQGTAKPTPKVESPQEVDAQREINDQIRKYRIQWLTGAVQALLTEIRGAV